MLYLIIDLYLWYKSIIRFLFTLHIIFITIYNLSTRTAQKEISFQIYHYILVDCW